MTDKRPESLLSLLQSLGEFTLLVCGIIGIAVEIFHDEGLLRKFIGQLVDAAFSGSLGTIVVWIVFALLAKFVYGWANARAENTNTLGNLLMRGMMLLGVYFLYLFITTGSFKI